MIKIEIDGEEYTEEQFQKDFVRMLDTLRNEYKGFKDCCGVCCENCPINTNLGDCNKFHGYGVIERVYKWAKAHPVKTNRDKLEEVFGVKVVKYFITNGKEETREYKFSNEENKIIKLFSLSLEDTSFSEWLHEEYKEPKEESEE